MGTARQMRERLQALQSNIITIAGEWMLENKEQIIALVIDQQEKEHIDSLGQPLRAYSPAYKLHKELEGKSGDTDFDETGEMHGAMNLSVDGEMYSIDSPAQTGEGELKSDWLRRWNYDEPVMELTEDNKKQAWLIIEPSFREKIEVGLD